MISPPENPGCCSIEYQRLHIQATAVVQAHSYLTGGGLPEPQWATAASESAQLCARPQLFSWHSRPPECLRHCPGPTVSP